MTAILTVCVTCKGTEPHPPLPEGATRPGEDLATALRAGGAPDGVEIRDVSCLSACKRGCAVALSAPEKWSYVYGGLTLDDTSAILEGAAKYAAQPDGLVPWRDRPEIFRKQSIARVPPLALPKE